MAMVRLESRKWRSDSRGSPHLGFGPFDWIVFGAAIYCGWQAIVHLSCWRIRFSE